MRVFLAEVRVNLRSPVSLAAWGFLTILMAIAGPFGSYEAVPFPGRFLFWLILTSLALVLAVALRVLIYAQPGLAGLWRGGVLTSAVVAVLMTWPVHLVMANSAEVYPLLPPGRGELALFIFCLTLGFCAFRHALDQAPERGAVAVAPARAVAAVPRLVERLAPELQAPVLRVSGRDHYVDVLTTAGMGSLLMRFSDALAELDDVRGLRVHRSHWVAEQAVTHASRDGARVMLHLVQGNPVPVSRTYMLEVERRGWLDQA
jgi:hypothetical protein